MVASRNSRKAAHNALKAYQATPNFHATDGMLTSIVDLITDLLHLAEAVSGQDGEQTGEHAIYHYQLDLDEVAEPELLVVTDGSKSGFPEVMERPPGFTGPWAG